MSKCYFLHNSAVCIILFSLARIMLQECG